MAVIYHITTKSEWAGAQQAGFYKSPSLQEEGFIHCSSSEEQVQGVLNRYFAGKTDLLKLVIDTDKLDNRFVYEWSPSVADTFPHVYGPINLDAVTDIIEI